MTKIAEATNPYLVSPSENGMRVNARLDEATARVLRQLMQETGMSVTELIPESIHRFYLQERVESRTPKEAFADLIGSMEGPADLATRYKTELADTLRSKHG